MKYNNFIDEEVINLIRDGDHAALDYLMDKYKNLVRKKASDFYIVGGDREDLVQEGMIGLYKAVRDYKHGLSSSFYSFADLCITRQIYTAINSSNTKKNQPLNNYISFEVTKEEEAKLRSSSKLSMEEVLSDGNSTNPEEVLINKESANMMKNELYNRLSEFETQVVELYIDEYNYLEIADILKKEPKAIDNALQRVRRKLQDVMEKTNFC